MSAPAILQPTFEQHHNGFAVGRRRPRLSWRFLTSADTVGDWTQTTYEIEVTSLPSKKVDKYVVLSEDSILVPWPAASLSSRDRAEVRVRCYGMTSKVASGY